jgi:hypothetical protein
MYGNVIEPHQGFRGAWLRALSKPRRDTLQFFAASVTETQEEDKEDHICNDFL